MMRVNHRAVTATRQYTCLQPGLLLVDLRFGGPRLGPPSVVHDVPRHENQHFQAESAERRDMRLELPDAQS